MTAIRIPQLIVAASFVVALAIYGTWSVHHDVAWLMYCGQRMFEGARLYVDCVEVNPPISFYLTLLPAYVAHRFDLPANLSLAGYVLPLIALTVALSVRICNEQNRSQRWWVGAVLAVVLLFTPINNFGQREHFAVILALPYLFCCAARMSGQPVSRRLAFVAGLMAGIGFSIKHYFVLVPLVIEVVLLVKRRSLKSLNRTEVYAAILAALAHAIYAVSAHPEYFTKIAPMALVAYNGYAAPYYKVLTQSWCLATAFGLAYYVRVRRIAAPAMAADVLAIAAAVFFVIYVIQDRGWQYHILPAQVLILTASLIIIVKTFLSADFNWRSLSIVKRPLVGVAAVVIVVQIMAAGAYNNIMPKAIWPHIAELSPNRTYYVLSQNISMAFPLPIEQKVTWGSRFPFQWLLPGVVRGLRDGCSGDVERCAKLEETKGYILESLAADFDRYQPGIVFVDLKPKEDPEDLWDHKSFDLLQFFMQGSPRFAEIWKRYEKVDEIAFITKFTKKRRTFEIWVRRTEPQDEPAHTSLGPAVSTGSKVAR